MKAWPHWRKRLLGGVPGLALILVVETPAVAQDQAGLDPVIVYAQKRATPLNDVPMSVSTPTGSDLADAGIHDIEGSVPATSLMWTM